MGFNPREGTVDTHSLVTSLAIGHCFVQLDALKLLLSNLKQLYVSQAEPEIDTFDITAVTSPEPPMSALLTPTTPRSEFFLSPISDSSQMSTSLSSDTRSPILHASPASPLLQVLSVCHTIVSLYLLTSGFQRHPFVLAADTYTARALSLKMSKTPYAF